MSELYRLYTEDKENLGEITLKYFPDGFTIYHGTGYWKGGQEYNATIEIVIPGKSTVLVLDKIQALADEIKTTNSQETVLIVCIEIESVKFA